MLTACVAALRKIWKLEGLRGIQAGLAPMIAFQIANNGTRLGVYPAIERALNGSTDDLSSGRRFVGKFTAGALAGVIGGYLGSPMYMVRMMQTVIGDCGLWCADEIGFMLAVVSWRLLEFPDHHKRCHVVSLCFLFAITVYDLWRVLVSGEMPSAISIEALHRPCEAQVFGNVGCVVLHLQ